MSLKAMSARTFPGNEALHSYILGTHTEVRMNGGHTKHCALSLETWLCI